MCSALLLCLLSSVLCAAFSSGERVIVLHLSSLGLANRLRTLADFHSVASYSGRSLLLSWQASADCNCSFTDLFSVASPLLKVLPYDLPQVKREAASYVRRKAEEKGLTFAEYDPEEESSGGDSNYFLSPNLFDSDVQVIYTDYWGSTALRHLPCQHFMASRSRFYQSLVPIPEVSEVVERVLDEFSGKVMIGVHVRGYDAMYDWAVVPPHQADTQATTFGETLPLEQYIWQLRQIENKFTVSTTKNNREALSHRDQSDPQRINDMKTFESHKFFMATNQRDIKEQLRIAFPTSVSLEVGSDDLQRSNPMGMKIALIEWLILANSDIIIHTYGSSFAMEASYVHRRPLVGLWTKDVSIYYHDERLPFCGNMQFMKEFGTDGRDIEYTEGTTDRRKIKTKSIPLHHCQTLLDWGIENLYCSISPS